MTIFPIIYIFFKKYCIVSVSTATRHVPLFVVLQFVLIGGAPRSALIEIFNFPQSSLNIFKNFLWPLKSLLLGFSLFRKILRNALILFMFENII